MTKIEEVMTSNPITVSIPGNRNDVLKLMVKHNLTGVPVVKKTNGALAGMITHNDIFKKPQEDQLALIMNKDPICLSPSDSVEDAANIMISCHMDHIPVVKGNELLGILTPTDLLSEVERKASGIPVEELALSPCVPIFEDASLRVAFTTFRVGKVNALPALGENGKLVGILTDRDLFNKSIVNGSVARLTLV